MSENPQFDTAKQIFVGKLPKDCTELMMREYFSQFGTVTKCHVKRMAAEGGGQGRSRGFGFVDFEDAETVQVVLDAAPHIMGEQEVGVRAAEDRRHDGPAGAHYGANAASRKLYVGQTENLTEDQLTAFFEGFGEIETFAHKGKYSFVTFKEQEVADKVAELKNHVLDGVDFYTVPPKNDGGLQNKQNSWSKGHGKGDNGGNWGGNGGNWGGNGGQDPAQMMAMMGMMMNMMGGGGMGGGMGGMGGGMGGMGKGGRRGGNDMGRGGMGGNRQGNRWNPY